MIILDDIDEEYIKSTKAILISGTSLAESPSGEAAIKAVLLAKKNNTRIIFDIDYREYNWKNNDEISIYYSMVAKEADIIMGSKAVLVTAAAAMILLAAAPAAATSACVVLVYACYGGIMGSQFQSFLNKGLYNPICLSYN